MYDEGIYLEKKVTCGASLLTLYWKVRAVDASLIIMADDTWFEQCEHACDSEDDVASVDETIMVTLLINSGDADSAVADECIIDGDDDAPMDAVSDADDAAVATARHGAAVSYVINYVAG